MMVVLKLSLLLLGCKTMYTPFHVYTSCIFPFLAILGLICLVEGFSHKSQNKSLNLIFSRHSHPVQEKGRQEDQVLVAIPPR